MSKNKNNKPISEDFEQNDVFVEEEEKLVEIENNGEFEAEEETFVEEVEEEVKEEPVIEKKAVNVDEFIARKLKVINEIGDEAKANAFASRVLRNK